MRLRCVFTGMLLLTGCVSLDRERTEDYALDGMHLYERGDYRGSCQSFLSALTLKPEDPNLLYNTARCYDRLGDDREAEHYYRNCIVFAPDHAAAHHGLDSLLYRSGKTDQVEKEVQAWLAHSPRCAAAYAEEGWYWHQKGDLPRAQARLQQALELDPRDIAALTELGRVYESLKRPDRAVALYERVLDRDPKQTEIGQRVILLKKQGAPTQPQPD